MNYMYEEFFEAEDFGTRLVRRESETVKVSELQTSRLRASTCSSKSVELMTDAEVESVTEGIDLVLTDTVNHREWPVRSIAMTSLYDRLGIGGSALNRLTPEERVDLINVLVTKSDRKVQLIVLEDMVNCVLSDDKTKADAETVPLLTCFDEYRRMIGECFHVDDNDVTEVGFHGYYSHDGINCHWTLADRKETVNGQDYNVQLTLKSSDIGAGAITADARLVRGTVTIPMIDAVKIEHRKGAKANNSLYETFAMVGDSITAGLDTLNNLGDIKLAYPEACMIRLAKRAGLPMETVTEVVQRYMDNLPSGSKVTALDAYITLGEAVADYASRQTNPEWVAKKQNNLKKLLAAKWKEADHPFAGSVSSAALRR